MNISFHVVGIVSPMNHVTKRGGTFWAYGVVVTMFDFHRSDWGSNPGRGGKIS